MYRLALSLFLLCAASPAQTFTGTAAALTGSETTVSLQVSGVGVSDSAYGLESICFSISHPALQELQLLLRSPQGTLVDLTGAKTCKAADFNGTCLANSASVALSSTLAPYTGTFRPLGNLGRFNTAVTADGKWELIVKDNNPAASSGQLLQWSLHFGSKPAKPVILNSSNLPVLMIDLPAKAQPSSFDQLADVSMIDDTVNRNYPGITPVAHKGKALVHVRGASSRMFEKKSLKLELKDVSGISDLDVSLLGMPAESDWVLNACYTDKTLIRNALSQELWSAMGNYAPRYRFVELLINGEYAGVYMLSEQIKRGQQRVNVAAMNPSDTAGPGLEGGYIIQIDRSDEKGWYSLHPGVSANGAKFYYQYNYPSAKNITPQQEKYIKAFFDSIESTIASAGFADLQDGYHKYINEETFIDVLIMSELSKNVDAYKLSAYYYKDAAVLGGRLNAGPLWDFDLAWSNCNFGDGVNPALWQYLHNNSQNPIPTWWRRLAEDSLFSEQLYCRYTSLRKSALSHSSIVSVIDRLTQKLSEARQRNFMQYPIIGAYVYANPQNQLQMTYDAEVAYLKSWIPQRLAWLDNNLPGACSALPAGIQEQQLHTAVFPNPASTVFCIRSEVMHAGQLVVSDIMGRLYMLTAREAATHLFEVSTAELPAGIYFVPIPGTSPRTLKLVLAK